jgi:hypothetical protein
LAQEIGFWLSIIADFCSGWYKGATPLCTCRKEKKRKEETVI